MPTISSIWRTVSSPSRIRSRSSGEANFASRRVRSIMERLRLRASAILAAEERACLAREVALALGSSWFFISSSSQGNAGVTR